MGGTDWNERGPDFDPDTGERMETPALSAEETTGRVALNAARTLADLYSAERLVADANQDRQRIDRLPAWPGCASLDGHGWGRAIDGALGGIVPGSIYLLGAAEAKAGKTSFLMQLADGLALLSAERAAGRSEGPLLPALILSEMSAAALTWRTLGRWLGVESRVFRGRPYSTDPATVADWENVVARGRAALAEGPLAEARRFQRMRATLGTGPKAVAEAVAALDAWRDDLRAETGREVWPVLVVDPIQRLQDGAKGEVEALNELAATVRKEAHDRGLVVLMTSDTNKASAKREEEEGKTPTQRAAAVLRGSYQLVHVIDAALYLERTDGGEDSEDWRATVPVTVTVAPNRWGPVRVGSFDWCKATGRFTERAAPAPMVETTPNATGGRRPRRGRGTGLGGSERLVEYGERDA